MEVNFSFLYISEKLRHVACKFEDDGFNCGYTMHDHDEGKIERKKVNRLNAQYEPVVDGDNSEIGHYISVKVAYGFSEPMVYITSPQFTVTAQTSKVSCLTYIYSVEKAHQSDGYQAPSISIELITDKFIVSYSNCKLVVVMVVVVFYHKLKGNFSLPSLWYWLWVLIQHSINQ